MSETRAIPTSPARNGSGVADGIEKESFWLRRQKLVVGSLSMVALLVVWELVARLAIDDPAILPAPSLVLSVCLQHLTLPYPAQNSTLPEHTLYSIVRILIGFVAGSIAGIAIGAAMSAIKWVRYAIDPVIELMRPLPPLAFIPLLVVWFGIGEVPKMVLIFIGVVPIMIIATLAGLDGVPKQLLDAAASLGASPRYAMVHVRIRAALVPIVTGMRVAVGVSWTSIVAAEMIAADHGIGYVILEAGNYLDTALVFSAIIIIGIVGLVMDRALRLILRKLDPTQ
ncbi:ABC transporter permease [Labrys monachus]|uniref:NitT/TauT family transport system permease protein/taurine transport system permease protein n=1 Tax=Labrys monachus TaxID=217067 RepID=A0ABU0FA87_9HYPH|nr:ABC transporter permease [Labrys monachus]MDQ0391537.1 NitT/TauT family transport system permease protein/taurine transport system permease protein [Labrys monachus]